jgi:hypothetical protein
MGRMSGDMDMLNIGVLPQVTHRRAAASKSPCVAGETYCMLYTVFCSIHYMYVQYERISSYDRDTDTDTLIYCTVQYPMQNFSLQ